MKIVTKEDTGKIAFKHLNAGKVFKINGTVYLKIFPLILQGGVFGNAIRLSDGYCYGFQENEFVIALPEAELHC